MSCARLGRDTWAQASPEERREFHSERMKLRRAAQRSRIPNSRYSRSTSIATGNRHGGEHQHAREIARRSRQSASPAPS